MTGSSVTIPNAITFIRILLAPIFVILLMKGAYGPGLAVFFVAGVSDAFDGFLARRLDQKTLLGAYLDPIADKVLLISALICLTFLKSVPVWLTGIVIVRDAVTLTGVILFGVTRTYWEIRPRISGKAATFCQIAAVVCVLLEPFTPAPACAVRLLFVVTAGVTVVACLQYVYIGVAFFRRDADAAPPRS